MRSPEGPRSSGNAVEARQHPEVKEILEFLNIYKQIQEITAWLVEAGSGTDPAVRAAKRKHLRQLMSRLGFDPESPDSLRELEDLRSLLFYRTLHPKPRVEVPDADYFKDRIEELIANQAIREAPYIWNRGSANLVDLARYGHTDWASLRARTASEDVSEHIRGVATIMADPVAYQVKFAGIGISRYHKAADHIEVAGDWSIANGRHRSLATRSLGEEYVFEAGMSQWIPVTVE